MNEDEQLRLDELREYARENREMESEYDLVKRLDKEDDDRMRYKDFYS